MCSVTKRAYCPTTLDHYMQIKMVKIFIQKMNEKKSKTHTKKKQNCLKSRFRPKCCRLFFYLVYWLKFFKSTWINSFSDESSFISLHYSINRQIFTNMRIRHHQWICCTISIRTKRRKFRFHNLARSNLAIYLDFFFYYYLLNFPFVEFHLV